MSVEIQIHMAADMPTPTVKVWDPLAHATPVETVTLTQDADRKGLYRGTFTGPVGWYSIDKFSGSSLQGTSWINVEAASGVYVEADPRSLSAIKAKTDLIGSVPWLSSGGTLTSGQALTIKIGDKVTFTLTSTVADAVADLTGKTVRFGVKDMAGNQIINTTATVLVATGLQSVSVTLLPAVTILLSPVTGKFDVQAEFASNDIATFLTGDVTIVADYSGTAS
jgi:hypothetical protein